jgi:hypothetical protein
MIVVYDYICMMMCVRLIFLFKTSVKLKWGMCGIPDTE